MKNVRKIFQAQNLNQSYFDSKIYNKRIRCV